MAEIVPDGRGRRTNVTGIPLRHRRHHREPRDAAERSRSPTCRTACLPALLAPAGNGWEGGRVERRARLVEPLVVVGGAISCTAMVLGSRADMRGYATMLFVGLRVRCVRDLQERAAAFSTSSTRCRSGGGGGGATAGSSH